MYTFFTKLSIKTFFNPVHNTKFKLINLKIQFFVKIVQTETCEIFIKSFSQVIEQRSKLILDENDIVKN